MANKNFPGPSINRLIDTDPQIIKVPLDEMGWGSRKSSLARLNNSAQSNDPAAPGAPEMVIKHIPSN
jgi:hypothetical protein